MACTGGDRQQMSVSGLDCGRGGWRRTKRRQHEWRRAQMVTPTHSIAKAIQKTLKQNTCMSQSVQHMSQRLHLASRAPYPAIVLSSRVDTSWSARSSMAVMTLGLRSTCWNLMRFAVLAVCLHYETATSQDVLVTVASLNFAN